ncbi:RNA-directed DNA polymerase [Thalassospira tepidiphila]|uniref:RNA-directed DNA polymerase n=1 Tax=Thalassospira tepidiphila TaxID=393657 RepID=UPI0029201026|nr:reverse transcriptase [Thalassospira tepidiphila]
MLVNRSHFKRAATEIGENGENDTLPYDIDSAFVREKADELSNICINLFKRIESFSNKDAAAFVNGLNIRSERLLTPSGSHGFRISTKIDVFWNLYLNGIALAIAETHELKRSNRGHSYWLADKENEFFNRAKSWRAYKEATLQEPLLNEPHSVVIQTDISSFYEHIYHHRLENLIKDLIPPESNLAIQIDRILSKLASGRSFGLPVGGQCARVLAEVMMTPIDQSLADLGIIWHRYVDDFTIICRSQSDAYSALSNLSHALADYGLSLNRSKTTLLSGKHYKDFIEAQFGDENEDSKALRDLDLHYDPYSDAAQTEYEELKRSFESIDIQFLLDLEKQKSQPDNFVLAQIGRALKFQEPKVALQLCQTLLDTKNLDSFRASWSKIMRGVYAVRAISDFSAVFERIDELLDRIPLQAPHLLLPEANLLHFLRSLKFKRTDVRGSFVRAVYDQATSQTVKRACIDCWKNWNDRTSFLRLRNNWANLGTDEQRSFWLAAGEFGDEGQHARKQLKSSAISSWKLGFEKEGDVTFSRCYMEWSNNGQ